MVNLTRIYTRTGDDGTTSLGDFSRVSKNDARLHAYADSNEANAAIGIAVACGDLPDEVRATLQRVQNELFDVGADLSTPLRHSYDYPPLRVEQPWIDDLEKDCDHYLEQVEKLRSFILPGGTAGIGPPAPRDDHRASCRALGVGGRRPARHRPGRRGHRCPRAWAASTC